MNTNFQTSLHIARFGRTRAGGVPLVFLHGFMGSHASFEQTAGFLPDWVRPMGIDLPGHGRSRFAGSASIGSLQSAQDVAALILSDLRLSGIDSFFLYGYSMGGRIAQQAALAAPERVRHLIVESAAFGIADAGERIKRYENDCRMLPGIDSAAELEAFLKKWHDMPLFRTLGRDLKKRLIAAKKKNAYPELKRALSLLSVGNQPYMLPSLASAPFPMTFFYGKEDEKYVQIAADAAQHLPDARFRFFPGASHNIHAQYPQKIALAIAEILRGA